MSETFAKVTVTVEEENGAKYVLEVPKAMRISRTTKAKEVEHLYGVGWPKAFIQNEMDLEISLTGVYSETEGYVFRETTTAIATEIKKDGDSE